MTHTIAYDEQVTCRHVPATSCYRTYVTVYTQQQVPKCRDAFRKSCSIDYEKQPVSHRVQECFRPISRQCGIITGRVKCSKQYQTICETVHPEQEQVQDQDCKYGHGRRCDEESGRCARVPTRRCRMVANKSHSPSTHCRVEEVLLLKSLRYYNQLMFIFCSG